MRIHALDGAALKRVQLSSGQARVDCRTARGEAISIRLEGVILIKSASAGPWGEIGSARVIAEPVAVREAVTAHLVAAMNGDRSDMIEARARSGRLQFLRIAPGEDDETGLLLAALCTRIAVAPYAGVDDETERLRLAG